MTNPDLQTTLSDWLAPLAAHRSALMIGLLLASVVLLGATALKVRKIARSERPDDVLSNIVMVIGLGWSSEAVWEIARHQLHLPLGLTLLLFLIFESLLTLAMIRAKRHMREFGWPGRFGTTAWTIAGSMSLVAVSASHSLAEAALRMAIPLLVTKQWWDGLIGGAKKPAADVSTFRWTPRRLLLALGAIEPGERDVQTVHRERLTQQMTTLYHRLNHGSARLRTRRAARLARLSLTADVSIIAEVQRRGDRALWFQVPPAPDTTAPPSTTATPSTTAPSSTTAPISNTAPTSTTAPTSSTATPSTTAPSSTASTVPATPDVTTPIHVNTTADMPSSEPATTPETVTAERIEPVPTPAQIAARVTPSPTSIPLRPTANRPAPAGVSKPTPHTAPTTPATPLAASAADTPVTEPKPAQLPLPMPVDAALVAKAREIAQQYRTETGGPIKAGQLAARLRVNSELATQALAVLDLEPNSPATPTPTVNGRPVKAAR